MLIKISILSIAYTGIVTLAISCINVLEKWTFLQKLIDQKDAMVWILRVSLFIVLFFFSFSYWGNHGMGDSARVPIGYGQAMNNIDGQWTYFHLNENREQPMIRVEKFAVQEHQLSILQEDGQYLVIHLQTLERNSYSNRATYNRFADNNNLANSSAFKDFSTHYQAYWKGWRFYLLP
ncbi:MAG: hypothetical protein ACRBFS_16500 [Aureispira sp.]